MRGPSFSNGQWDSGASVCNGTGANCGPGAQEFAQGWPWRVASHWDHSEPGIPA